MIDRAQTPPPLDPHQGVSIIVGPGNGPAWAAWELATATAAGLASWRGRPIVSAGPVAFATGTPDADHDLRWAFDRAAAALGVDGKAKKAALREITPIRFSAPFCDEAETAHALGVELAELGYSLAVFDPISRFAPEFIDQMDRPWGALRWAQEVADQGVNVAITLTSTMSRRQVLSWSTGANVRAIYAPNPKEPTP